MKYYVLWTEDDDNRSYQYYDSFDSLEETREFVDRIAREWKTFVIDIVKGEDAYEEVVDL